MKLSLRTTLPLTLLLLVVPNTPSLAISATERKVETAIETFEDMMRSSKTRIPKSLLRRSQAVAIIPDVGQGGFFIGGRRGTGVIVVRRPDSSWSNPSFINITGGSLGLQFGGRSSDLIFVFPNRGTFDEIMSGTFKFGGSISATAGPIGDTPVEPVAEYINEPIYTYSRSVGLFGGVALEGSELGFNRDKNRDFYGAYITPRRIFSSPEIKAPVVVNSLHQALAEAEADQWNR